VPGDRGAAKPPRLRRRLSAKTGPKGEGFCPDRDLPVGARASFSLCLSVLCERKDPLCRALRPQLIKVPLDTCPIAFGEIKKLYSHALWAFFRLDPIDPNHLALSRMIPFF
jgi:hypothetical protein